MTWAVVFSKNGLITTSTGPSLWPKAANIYEYLFANKDRDNIDNAELLAFRLLAKVTQA
jgi:hypothetical protein